MKIAIICPYNIYLPGGVLNHVINQTDELRRRGHHVVIITPRPQGYTQDAPEGVFFVGRSGRIRAQHTAADISASVDVDVIDQLLAREQFDIIHVHEPLIPFLALQLLSRVKCPTIGTFHAALPDTLLAKSMAGSIGPYKRSIFKHLTAVTAVSKAATSFILDDIEEKAIAIIPNGIEVERYKHVDDDRRENATFLYVGRLEKRKGVRYLIDAFGVLKHTMPQARLIVAGDGPERNMLEARARQRKVADVSFLGHVTDETKTELLTRCTVFVAPALYGESFGIVLLEAMAAGAVTVAGSNPGYDSVLTGTGRLSLLNPKLIQEFARRMELLATDAALQKVWRAWATREIPKYSYHKIVDQYVALYESLVPSRQ